MIRLQTTTYRLAQRLSVLGALLASTTPINRRDVAPARPEALIPRYIEGETARTHALPWLQCDRWGKGPRKRSRACSGKLASVTETNVEEYVPLAKDAKS